MAPNQNTAADAVHGTLMPRDSMLTLLVLLPPLGCLEGLPRHPHPVIIVPTPAPMTRLRPLIAVLSQSTGLHPACPTGPGQVPDALMPLAADCHHTHILTHLGHSTSPGMYGFLASPLRMITCRQACEHLEYTAAFSDAGSSGAGAHLRLSASP